MRVGFFFLCEESVDICLQTTSIVFIVETISMANEEWQKEGIVLENDDFDQDEAGDLSLCLIACFLSMHAI